jgi:hypothetical protein
MKNGLCKMALYRLRDCFAIARNDTMEGIRIKPKSLPVYQEAFYKRS